jgi:Secretion system C-terminal sorting domain/Beta-propeller repeat
VNGGGSDAIIIKLNATGSALIYSTYVGGNGHDSGYDIALDSFNNAYITGYTESSNYLVSPDAFQNGHEGGFTDAFVTKINASGTRLIYSTYIGGNGDDTAYSIAVDTNDNAYITGLTESTNFDITNGAFQTTNAAGRDVFVTKINPTGTALIYSTYVGGDNNDVGLSIALDTYANGYITGLTWSTDFDTTTGAFQTINAGARDLFVFKLDFIPELSINENTKHNLFNVFPNPSQGFYQIVFENTFDDSQIEVYDLLGRLIFNQQDKNKNSMILDLSNEQDGVYILKVKTNNIQQVMRLVKL